MNPYNHNPREGVQTSDVIEWDPPTVNFEFNAGICVQHVTDSQRFTWSGNKYLGTNLGEER